MNLRKYVLAFVLGVFIAAILTVIKPQVVHAQTCYDPTGAPIPCPETEKKKKRPTATPYPPTATSTPTQAPSATLVLKPLSGGEGGTLVPIPDTPTATVPPWFLTVVACRNSLEATAIATLGYDDILTPSLHDTVVAPCENYAPTATQLVIPPVAGPIFVPPGVKNVLILVLLIGVLLTGGSFIIVRGFKPPNPNKPK